MAESPLAYEDECFFVAPISKEGSDIRRRSDGVRDFIVKPAVAELGLRTVRADELEKPGQITLQVIEHVLRAKAVVADLTGANPNVFYELAVRHTAKLPVILIAAEDEIDRLPFDIQQMRVIGFDHQDLASASRAKERITQSLREGLEGAVDSPIATAMNLAALEEGTSVERTLADLVTRFDDLSRTTNRIRLELRRMSWPGGPRLIEYGNSATHPVPVRRIAEMAITEDPATSYSVVQVGDDSWEVQVRHTDGYTRGYSLTTQPSNLEIEAVLKDFESKHPRMDDEGGQTDGGTS